MPSRANRFGLSRDIPEDTKRKVRQACGFGCVICGCAIYQYAHFKPEYQDATRHDPNQIALLCGQHHDYVTRGIWQKDTLEHARRNPRCLQDRFSRGAFAYDSGQPTVSLGNATFLYPRSILRIHGRRILAVAAPEEPGRPMRVSGTFYNRDNTLLFEIKDNEWSGPSDAWDIETEGSTITIRRAHREIALRLTVEESRILKIDRLDMYYSDIRVYADGDGVRIGSPSGQAVRFDGRVWAGECCIDVRKAPRKTSPGLWAVSAGGLVIEFGCGASCIVGNFVSPAS